MVSKPIKLISSSSVSSLVISSVAIPILLLVLKSAFKTYYIPVKNYIYRWINYGFRWLYLVLHPMEFLGVKTKQIPCDPKYDDDGITCWSKPGYGQIMRNPPMKYPCDKYDSRFRDDGTSCWLDTYGRGAGRMPDKAGCDNGQRDDGTSCWEDWKCNTSCPGGGPWWNVANCNTHCSGCGCIKKNLFDRQYCNGDEEKNGALCYPRCRPGYKAVGCCLCEPDGGPGIRKTLFDRHYCPPGQHMDGIHAFCYDDCKPGWRSDGALMCVKNENSANTIIPEIKVTVFDRQTCTDTNKYKLGPGNLLCYPIFPSTPSYNKDETTEVNLDTGY